MSDVRRLPRGRHGLTPEEVALDQRLRIVSAMAESMAVRGYVGTSVAEVIGRAGVSRETFYSQFSSKLDCFAHTLDVAAALLVERVEAAATAAGTDGGPRERVDRAIRAYLATVATEPGYARLLLVEVHAAGAAAIARRDAVQHRLATRMATVLELTADADRFACDLLVAGVGVLVTPHLLAGDIAAIAALHGPALGQVDRLLAGGGHR